MAFWLISYALWSGQWTKALAFSDTTELHRKFNDARDWVQLEGQDNWFFGGVLGWIGDTLTSIVESLQKLISIPAPPRPVPEIGWLGVVAIAAWVTYVVAGLRSTILVTLAMLSFGVLGLCGREHGHADHHPALGRRSAWSSASPSASGWPAASRCPRASRRCST